MLIQLGKKYVNYKFAENVIHVYQRRYIDSYYKYRPIYYQLTVNQIVCYIKILHAYLAAFNTNLKYVLTINCFSTPKRSVLSWC